VTASQMDRVFGTDNVKALKITLIGSLSTTNSDHLLDRTDRPCCISNIFRS
jgi:hypothetical protein